MVKDGLELCSFSGAPQSSELRAARGSRHVTPKALTACAAVRDHQNNRSEAALGARFGRFVVEIAGAPRRTPAITLEADAVRMRVRACAVRRERCLHA
jgi:hypothetical protein